MTTPMTYKGYTACIDYDDEDGLLIGRIAGIRDGVGFHAEDVAALRQAFTEAVDDYLDTCACIGKPPQRPIAAPLVAASGARGASASRAGGRPSRQDTGSVGGGCAWAGGWRGGLAQDDNTNEADCADDVRRS